MIPALSVLVGLLAVLGALGLGDALLGRRLELPRGLRAGVALALGLLAIGDLALLLGLAGLLRGRSGLALLAVAIGLGIARLPAVLRPLPIRRPDVLAASLVLLLLVAVALATVPTLFYDSLLYHLGSPRAWIDAGRIEAEPRLVQSGLPMGAEVVFLAAMRLGDPGGAGNESAQVVNALLAAALLGSVAAAASRGADGPRPGRLAALLLAGSPLFLELAFLPKSDLLAALLAFLALATAWSAGPALLVGLLLGGALTAKTTAATLAALPCAVLLLRRGTSGSRARAVGLAAAGALLAIAPWGLREAVFSWRHAVNDGTTWNAIRSLTAASTAAFRATTGARASMREGLAGVLALPREAVQGGEGSASYPGLVWLPAIAAGALAARRDPLARTALACGLATLTLRGALTSMPRFGLVAYAAIAVAGGRGLDLLLTPGRRAGALAVVLPAAVACLLGVVQAGVLVGTMFQPQRVLLGQEDRVTYVVRRLPGERAIRWANEHLRAGAGERVLLVGETRRSGLLVPHEVCDAFHENPLHEILRRSGGAAASGELRDRGFAWVLRNRDEEARFLAAAGPAESAATLARVERFLLERSIVLYRDESAAIHALR